MKKGVIFFILILLLFPTIFALSNNSIILEKYKLEINTVLEGYPELENVTILFREKEIPHTMQSRLKLNFLFLKKENHQHQVILNNGTKSTNGILVEDLSFEQRVGVLSHELGHVVDYESKNDLGIIFFGAKYLFPKSKSKIEKKVDRIAINHGFGEQLINFEELTYGEDIPEKYKKKKLKYYYTPEELRELQEEYKKSP
jgi:hypothetical protein